MKTSMVNGKICNEIIHNPKKTIPQFDLVYVNEEKMPITRLKTGNSFSYEMKGRIISQKNHLKRIAGLVLPPAWEEVRITNLSNGHLQAVGVDNKNRKQYCYHPKWVQIRNQAKFYKITALGESLPSIRRKVDKDLEQKEWTKSKVIALVIRLMEETHIRIGNEKYARQNKSYGLTTLRKKHISRDKNLLRLEFVGKKGRIHRITIKNRKLIRLVARCEEISGWELFKYFDRNGEKKVLDSTDINAYLHTISGEYFTAKDFRTWSGSLIFFEALKELGVSEELKQVQKNIILAYDEVANALGNTRAVCRKFYVHPLLVSAYEDQSITEYFKIADSNQNADQYLSGSEVAMLDLLKKFKPDLE
jgi:DNA topoisomerase I